MDDNNLGKEYSEGDAICRQGEIGDRMYVIQAGRATVLEEVDGKEIVLGHLGPGDIFGEMALVDRKPRSATVRAMGRARILTLDKRTFLRGVHEDPSLAFRILQKMSERVRRLTEEVAHLREAKTREAPAAPRNDM